MDKLAVFQWLKHVHFPLWDVLLRSNRGELSFHYAALKGSCPARLKAIWHYITIFRPVLHRRPKSTTSSPLWFS